ncbi:chemotaxis protein CheW [Robertmurraya siralis]|jgi:purine-binding chemotaxis protein CheW|uniref:Chemotaxis protein CheW n=1 Tax=Robertmurraya siralis TaxID=77777 RepID=A0A920BT23_9BACI|nr:MULTISPECIES: chemotaxis protein CheW [Robertmurraya]MDF1506567.1 chemotaxis protein CheW [Robertmurraya sp. DFI.2.37]GIN61548.1 chemotaxis protein CheW [Robertmurraya siralis]
MAETLTEDIKFIVFQLKEKEYAIPVNKVNSIEKIEHITRVPGLTPYVKGVINLRGVVTPIIDLRLRFGLEEIKYTESTRVIIISFDDMEVGLIVDAANDVIDVNMNSIEPQPEVVGVAEAEYISGVAKIDKRLLILLDLEKILNRDEIRLDSKIEG